MPRVTYCNPKGPQKKPVDPYRDEKESLAKVLVEVYGAVLDKATLGKLLGLTRWESVDRWLKENQIDGIPFNGRKRYLVSDVVKRLYEVKIREGVV